MRPEPSCERARAALSARLDGELDASASRELDRHLEGCPDCRAQERDLRWLRRSLRVQPLEQEVPDLTEAIMARVVPLPTAAKKREVWLPRLRTAAVAAVVAVVVVGASIPFLDRRPATASAAEVVREVRAAAQGLHGYRASFEVDEWGWHPRVPHRSFAADIWFQAPERMRLEIGDLTAYPAGTWPRNEITLVANERTWWLREPATCPTEVLPRCVPARRGVVETRRVVGRQPFDGSTPVPTDVIVPIETFSDAGSIEVLGAGRVLDRDTYRVALSYRHAAPLVASLQSAGTWRPFHPLDRVEVWLDQATWFPLRFEVTAGTSPERNSWEVAVGVDDAPGAILLDVRATRFASAGGSEPGTFVAPETGTTRYGGFVASRGAYPSMSVLPADTAGLSPYRTGSLGRGRTVVAYVRGMTWLKVTLIEERRTWFPAPGTEEVRLGPRSWAYYAPAGPGHGRQATLPGAPRIVAESNLPREDLIEVVRSIGANGERVPSVVRTATATISYLEPKAALRAARFALAPAWLPRGYRATSATLTSAPEARSLTIHYRHPQVEYEGTGIRITQSRPVGYLPPTSEDSIRVRIGSLVARWSFERGELEWVDGSIYRAIAVPSGDLTTALRIAGSLS